MSEDDEKNGGCGFEISTALPPAVVHCEFVRDDVANVALFVGELMVVCLGFRRPECPARDIEPGYLSRDAAVQSGCPLAPIFELMDR